MDAIEFLGSMLGGGQVVSPTGRRVLSNNHPAFGHPHATHVPGPPVGQGGLGAVLAGAAKVYAARKAAEAQQRAAEVQHQQAHRHGLPHSHGPSVGGPGYGAPGYGAQGYGGPGFGAPGYCPEDFGGLAYEQAKLRALHLVRAMIMAAKADGFVCPQEEAAIAKQFGPHLSPVERQFIQQELARPIDVVWLANETPPDLRDDLYAASLVAINVDTNQEARYLHELAHALGLTHAACNLLHQRMGEPPLFR
jgi:uncharacterized membrane protein YebE (DUF533 family)